VRPVATARRTGHPIACWLRGARLRATPASTMMRAAREVQMLPTWSTSAHRAGTTAGVAPY
jgi:hypothetical protein